MARSTPSTSPADCLAPVWRSDPKAPENDVPASGACAFKRPSFTLTTLSPWFIVTKSREQLPVSAGRD
jgi:hypothetical protein